MSRFDKKYNHHRLQSQQYRPNPIPPPPGMSFYEPFRTDAGRNHLKSGYPMPPYQRIQHQMPPGLHHIQTYQGNGCDDLYMNKMKYVKKSHEPTERLYTCSTGSSEEDNMNLKQHHHKSQLSASSKFDRKFVVYSEGMPIFNGAPTEDDTKTLMLSFICKHSEKFVCSEFKNIPKDGDTIPLPSFAM